MTQTITMEYTMTSLWPNQPDSPRTAYLTIEVLEPEQCTPDLKIDVDFSSLRYTQGSDPLEISLAKVTNNNCDFRIELLNTTSGADADPTIFSVTQPLF